MTNPLIQAGGRTNPHVRQWPLRYTIGGVRELLLLQADHYVRVPVGRRMFEIWRQVIRHSRQELSFNGWILVSWNRTDPDSAPTLRELRPR